MSKKMKFCPICGSIIGMQKACPKCGYVELNTENNNRNKPIRKSVKQENLNSNPDPAIQQNNDLNRDPNPTIQQQSTKASSNIPSNGKPLFNKPIFGIPLPAEAEKPKLAEAEKPKPAEAEKPKPVEAEKPKPVEAEKPKPVEAEKPKPAEAEKPKSAEAEKPKPTEAEKPKPTETEKPKPAEAEKPKAKQVKKTKSTKVKKTKPIKTEITEPVKTKIAESENLEKIVLKNPVTSKSMETKSSEPAKIEKTKPVKTEKPKPVKIINDNDREQKKLKRTEKLRAIWDYFEPYLSEIGKWAWIVLILAGLVDITTTSIILAINHGLYFGTSLWEYIRNGILLVIAFLWVEPNFSPKLTEKKWNDLLEDDFGVILEKISKGKIQMKYRIPMMFIMGIIIEICSPLYIIGLVVLWPALLLMFFSPMSPYNWNKNAPKVENVNNVSKDTSTVENVINVSKDAPKIEKNVNIVSNDTPKVEKVSKNQGKILKNVSKDQGEEFKNQINQARHLIESGNYDGAIIDLEKIKNETNQLGFNDLSKLATNSIEQAQMLQNLIKMFNVSNKIKIEDICEQLNISRKEMLKIIFDRGQKFGVKIDDDYLVTENTKDLDSMMYSLLERSFEDWSAKEQTKEGKI